MKISILLDGYCSLNTAGLLPGVWSGRDWVAAKSLLVATEKERILIDTGTGTYPPKPEYDILRRIQPIYRKPEETIVNGLRQQGLGPDDIDIVINSHLHAAHAGNNFLFKKARFFLAKKEMEYIDSLPDRSGTTYVDDFYRYGIEYEQLQGEYRITDQVRIVPTPGHTPGHQSVIVEDGSRRVVWAGDVFPMRENYVRKTPMNGVSPRQSVESMQKLLKYEGPDTEWVFAHDPEQLSL